MAASPDGILLVDKPGGITSAGVVRDVKRAHRLKSVGHLGTLDPMATGLLPLCIGDGTKIAQFLGAEQKAYTGAIRLGIATDTLDVEGQVVAEAPVPDGFAARLAGVAAALIGPGVQLPPMYSAVKIAGRKLYEHARAGETVERAPRPVVIHELTLEPDAEVATIRFAVRCSKGTYVRVLAEDIAKALGTVGTLASLRRTRFGEFDVGEAEPLAAILARPVGDLPVLDGLAALRSVRRISVEASQARAIASGQRDALSRIAPPQGCDGLATLLAPNGRILAVVEAEGGRWTLRRVLMPEASQLYRP
ncbi:tRNA pseudouridine(55) synthase TruB [Candidatus Binatia bacterium]|jgi:tRNA pseudouridine55 synthase|nr:tRNA pseudouridine(55) synthase TruB [Candidatus Binatia bacterium]